MQINLRRNRFALALVALLVALPGMQTAQAQPMIEHVPDSAAIYIGWRGSDDMGPAYEGSNLQGIIEETGLLDAVPQLVQTIQQIAEQAPDEGVPAGQLVGMAGTLYSSMWTHGGAMYMLPPVEGGPPIPRLAIMWDNAKDNEELTETLNGVTEMINSMEQVPVFLSEAGDAIVLAVGFQAGELKFESLGKAERFTTAIKQVQADSAMVVYVDVQEWIAQVDQFAQMMQRQAAEWGDKDPFAETWAKLRDISGLTGVNRLMMTAGIKNKNWQTEFFLDAPAPRKGLLSLIDNKPLLPDNLTHVPKTATYLQVFSMDGAKVMKTVRDMLGAVEPGMVRQMDRGLAEANKQVGFDIEKELIKGMGPVWSMYIDPMIAGNGFGSMVMVNELSDAKQVERSLTKLMGAANAAMTEVGEDAPINIRFLTREAGDQTITYLGVPYVAPAWMIKDNRLYIALYPQALEMAAEHSGKATDSILANDAFKKTLAKFGDKRFTGVSFVDLPETAPDGYGVNLLMIQTLAGMGEMFSGEASAMSMPPVGKILPYLEPASSLTWVDEQGLHIQAVEPFPGSNLLGPARGFESTMMVSGPLAVGIMLPALGSAREAARQTQTMSQGRALVTGAVTYAVDHDNQMPDDLAQVLDYVGDAEMFIAGNSMRVQALPVGFDGWEKAKKDTYLRENSSFVLIPLGDLEEIENPAETVVLFQRPDDVAGGIVVAWADGHVTFEHDVQAITAQIKTQTGQTVEQLIQRQEQFGE